MYPAAESQSSMYTQVHIYKVVLSILRIGREYVTCPQDILQVSVTASFGIIYFLIFLSIVSICVEVTLYRNMSSNFSSNCSTLLTFII